MRMLKIFHVGLLAFLVQISTGSLFSQTELTSIGKPQNSTLFPIENGYINLANGNVHIEIPIENYPQRGGVKLPATLVYDSAIWRVDYNASTGSDYWQPDNVYEQIDANYSYTLGVDTAASGWRLHYFPESNNQQSAIIGDAFLCQLADGTSTYRWPYNAFGFFDQSGARHWFDIQTVPIVWDGCVNTTPYKDTPSGAAYANDGSGYYGVVSDYDSLQVWDKDGTLVYGPSSAKPTSNVFVYTPTVHTQIDRNGNSYSCGTVDDCSKALDTLGRSLVSTSIIQAADGSSADLTINVTSLNGLHKTYNVVLVPLSLSSAFNNPNFQEFSGQGWTISQIALPDGSAYKFTYENGSFGELTGMTLPHGGTVSFGYSSDSNSGISTPARWVSSYSGSNGSTMFNLVEFGTASNSTTGMCSVYTNTVQNSPSKTVHIFNECGAGLLEVAEDDYLSDGSYAARTMSYDYSNTTYSGSYKWINMAESDVTLAGNGGTAYTQYEYSVPGLGVPTTVMQWDYNSGVPGTSTPTRETDQELGYSVNGTIFPTSITYKDSTGSAVTKITYGYDESALAAAPSSTPNLTSVSGNRGNLTTLSVTDLTQAGTPSRSTHYTYDTAGQMQAVTDPNGNTTRYAYDSTDTFIVQATSPSTGSIAHVTSQTHDTSTGLLTSSTDQNGQTTTYNYDDIDRLSSIQFSNGGSPITLSSYEYSLNETDVTVQQSPTATTTVSRFVDGYGRPSQQVIGGVSTEWSYDSHGRLYSVTNPHLLSTTSATDGKSYYSYDGLGRITAQTDPLGNTTSYSYAGNIQTVTDPRGKQKQLAYDSFGDLSYVVEQNGSGALSWITNYKYNVFGKITSVQQHGGSTDSSQWRTRTFNYNGFGLLTSQTMPESGATSYSYDNNGNMLSLTDQRGLKTSYTYDGLNGVTSKTLQNGATYAYVYDAQDASGDLYGVGLMTSVSNGSNIQASFTHDPLGNLTSQTYCMPSNCAGAYKTSAQTDYLGNLTALTYPDGRQLALSYDGLNRLTGESWIGWQGTPESVAYLYNVAYYPPGQLATASYGNGVSLRSTYDAGQNLKTLGYSKAQVALSCKGYSWDQDANLISLQDKLPGVTRTFTYDQVGRLLSASDSGGSSGYSQSFSYDAWGNMQQSGSFTYAQSYDTTNRISGYSYDAAGNLLSEPSPIYNSYVYGADGMITSSNYTSYSYDGLGQRVQKAAGGATQEYFYFGGRLLSVRDGSSGTWTDRLYGAGGRQIATVAGTASAQPTWRIGDQLDSLTAQTDNSGNMTSSTSLAPFGQTISNTGSDAFLFTGKERDSESGNDYFGARYYSSRMGRFLSPDPSGLTYADPTNPQSLNLYSYVLNNPLKFTDPSGMECVWDDGSYDAADDPDSGSAGLCYGLGGTWIDPALFENALLLNNQQANIAYGQWSDQADASTVANWLVPNVDDNDVTTTITIGASVDSEGIPVSALPSQGISPGAPAANNGTQNSRSTLCKVKVGAGIALDAAGTAAGLVPGAGAALVTTQVSLGLASSAYSAFNGNAGFTIGNATGAQLSAVRAGAVYAGLETTASVLPVIGTIYNGAVLGWDVWHANSDYQACMAGK